jgi:hypothetical protein
MNKRLVFAALTGIIIFASVQLFGLPAPMAVQRLVTIEGVVSDSNGNPLSGAEVRVISISPMPVLTDTNGCYRIQRGISGSGIIILKISKPGYKTMIKSNIVAHFNEQLNFIVNCQLEPL